MNNPMNTISKSANNFRSVFLGWQDDDARAWYPIGRLDADVAGERYEFGYTHGMQIAEREIGFPPLIDFPDLNRRYRSVQLFPLFENRVMNAGRNELPYYLSCLGLAERNPVDILSVSGGYRHTDSFLAFPKIAKRADGTFSCRFFLHNWRDVTPDAEQHIDSLKTDDELYLCIEPDNPEVGLAVQIQTPQHQMLGWAPRYFAEDLIKSLHCAPDDYHAKVVQVNPMMTKGSPVPVPDNERLLIELSGKLPDDYQPMSTKKFQLINSGNPLKKLGRAFHLHGWF